MDITKELVILFVSKDQTQTGIQWNMVDVSLEDPRIHQVGFARLRGSPCIDHIVNKYEIVLGRKNKNKPIDVSLGDTMSVSRQHARIYYDFAKKGFYLLVLGKNGVSVDGTMVSPGDAPVVLSSGCLLEVGNEVSFHFLLPKPLNKVFLSSTSKRKSIDHVEPEPQPDNKRHKIDGCEQPQCDGNPTDADNGSMSHIDRDQSVANALLNAIKGGLGSPP